MWLVVLAACRPDPIVDTNNPPDTGTSEDTSVSHTGAASTGSTGDTAPTVDPCIALCDDGFDCTEDACDDQDRCIYTSLETCDWPASNPADALSLADLDPDGGLRVSVSGVGHDPATGAVWLVRNAGPEGVWRLMPDGAGGYVIDEDDQGDPAVWIDFASYPEDDFEGIAVVDTSPPDVVYLMEESSAQILAVNLTRAGITGAEGRWDVSEWVAPNGVLGPEGLTFVPDAILADQGFVDGDGLPRTSVGGMGGLMFVAHQSGGLLHAFDLYDNGAVDLVGVYETGHVESSGLEVDAVTGRLYVWHGGINHLEVARLSSTEGGTAGQRLLDSEYVFDLPSMGNVEGVEIIGDCADGVRPLAVVTDDGAERSVLVYTDWPLGCPPQTAL